MAHAAAELTARGTGRYDGAVMHRDSPAAKRGRCAHCGAEIDWLGNPHRPFCSLSCRLVDLGVWLDERYRIPGPDFPAETTADGDAPRPGG